MEAENTRLRIVARLIGLTRAGRVHWSRRGGTGGPPGVALQEPEFRCDSDGLEFQAWSERRVKATATSVFAEQQVRLRIIDQSSGEAIDEFSDNDVSVLADLFELVRAIRRTDSPKIMRFLG